MKKILYLLLIIISSNIYSLDYHKMNYIPQTWNNCGPASLSMIYSYWDIDKSQHEIESVVKTHKMDIHISIEELASVVTENSLESEYFINCSFSFIKDLIDNKIPLIVPIWYTNHNGEQMGHYIVITDYNENEIIIMDSLRPDKNKMLISDFKKSWENSGNKIFMVYPKDTPILSYKQMTLIDEETFFSKYNLGRYYLKQKLYSEAYKSFSQALKYKYNFKYFWYNHEILEAYYMNKKYDELLNLTSSILRHCKNIEEVWYWRGKSFLALDDKINATLSIKKALAYRSNYLEAKLLLKELQ